MCEFERRKACEITQLQKIFSILLICFLVFTLNSCGNNDTAKKSEDPNAPDRDNTPVVVTTNAPGDKVFEAKGATVDYSNANQGYIMTRYTGSNPKVKLQIIFQETTYNYDLTTDGNWEVFPLSLGNGQYTVGVFERISGETYAQLLKDSFKINLKDEFKPFLCHNQYVNFTKDTNVVALSEEICAGSKSDLGAVEKMFEYVISNITYDEVKAQTVQPGYLPNIDEALNTGKGICFDYASVMSAMLRAQRIPCKLVIGYAGQAYHAWISVYTKETGWVENMIKFDSDTWTRMDPTFAASGDNSDPNVVGDGENYQPQYYY